MKTFEMRALEYAEKYGVIEYKVKGNQMIYLVSYPPYGREKGTTYKAEVNLETGKEVRTQMKNFQKKGLVNR